MDLDDATPPSIPFDAHDHDHHHDLAAGPDGDHVNGGGFSPDRRPKKSSSTCTTCRARKVRCNGARNVCSNCQRLGFPCSYDDGDSGAWSVSLPRRRVKQACLSCHSRKARCSGHVPVCERCRAQGIDCVYRPSKRSRVSSRMPGDHSPHSLDGDLDRDDMHNDSDPGLSDPASNSTSGNYHHDVPCPDDSFDALVVRTFEKFFRHVHHIPMYSFLHRASLQEQYNAGKVDKALLLALVGITSCLTDMGPGMREYGDQCINEAEHQILADYTRPSTIKVQALVFMIKHRILSNRFSSAFVLVSIASRFAAAMRLNYDSPSLCFLAQESRRRLMWSLFCIDLTISGGYRDFSLWRADKIHVALPCNERNFEFDLPQPTEKLVPDSNEPRAPQSEDIGSLALHIRILHIRQKIIEFTKGVLASRNVHTGDLQTRVLELHQELDHFANHLPLSFQFSESSLRLRAYSPRICVFVMIHLWWRQCHCDLYRLALVGLREALPRSALDNFDDSFIEHCQRQCFDHSAAMASIFSAMQRLNAKPVADLDLAICAYQCARMLTYAYHTNGSKFGLTQDSVVEQAHVCQRAIKQCCTGPAAASIRADLEKLITQGLSTRATPARVASPGANKRVKTSHKSYSLSRQSLMKNMEAKHDTPAMMTPPNSTDRNSTTTNANANNHNTAENTSETPFSSSTPSAAPAAGTTTTTNNNSTTTNPPLPPSIISDPWASENQISPDILQANPDLHVTRGRTALPDEVAHDAAPDFGASELNNAYEGDFEGLGIDSGLDFAMGMDLNMWVPGAGDWMTTDMLSSGVDV